MAVSIIVALLVALLSGMGVGGGGLFAVYLSVFTDGVGEPEGIVSVAHREIDGNASLFNMRDQKILFYFQKVDHGCYFLSSL